MRFKDTEIQRQLILKLFNKMVKPVRVTAIKKYVIQAEFEDGVSGEADLSDSAGLGIFKFWDKDNNFFDVFINKETFGIAWNEDLEIDPETVYTQIISELV